MRNNSLIAALALVCIASPLRAHTVHQSTAEAEYNPTTKKLEVSLTVFISDLEQALVLQCECEMRLDKTPAAEFDTQIQTYLAKTFVVTDAAGQATRMEWVGRALLAESARSEEPAVTLFFTVLLAGELADTKLRHAVFCDLFKDQTNLLHLRGDQRKLELRFSRDDLAKTLGSREPSP